MSEPQDDARQEQLRAAAEALIGWIHDRRAAWADEAAIISEFGDDAELPSSPPFTAPVFTPPAAVFTPQPPVFTPPAAPLTPPATVFTPPPPPFADLPVFAPSPPEPERPEAFDSPAAFDAEPAVSKAAKPAVRLKVQRAAVGSLAAALIQSLRRVAPLAAVLAVVVGAAWMARPYVGKVKTWLTEMTENATVPKPETVVAKPTPPRGAAGAARMGQLIARSEPPGAKVLVDGKERGVTPLTLDDVTIGSHTVVLQSEKGSVRRTVSVSSDRTAVVSESIFAGWLTVFAPFEVQITEGAGVIRLDDNGKVLLPPGTHELRLENRDLGFQETRRVDVQPGQTTSLSLVATPSTLTVTATAPAVVSIDGQQVGETPLTNQPIALGTRDIVVKAADGTERRFTKKVTVAPVRIDVDFSQP